MVNDSYEKINNEIQMYEAEKMSLPKGYIRKKNINGKEYTYLQYREGDKIKSVYMDKNTAAETEKEIAERKRIEDKIRELKQRKKILEKKLGIREYLPEKEVDYENYSLFMSQLAHDHKRLGTEGFIAKYDTSKYRGINKRYLKGYRDYILGNKTENSRKSNCILRHSVAGFADRSVRGASGVAANLIC